MEIDKSCDLRKMILILTVLLHSFLSSSQNYLPSCNCSVNAGKDIEICEPGGTVQLNGAVTGDFVSFHWLGAPELSDTSKLNPTATVAQNTTFTLATKCRSTTFLPIINPNFSSGNVGFSTGYIYDAVPGTFGPGKITVTNSPVSFNSVFSNCGDHTTGSGNMLLIDGSTVPGTDVWCQSINLAANTSYAFEFWFTTVFPPSPPQLQVTLNGSPIGTISLSATTCIWQKVSYCFTTTSSGPYSLCINEFSGVAFGNDFALDDFSLVELCTYEDKVNVIIEPKKTTNVDAEICQGQSYTLANQSFVNEGSYDIPLKTWKGCDSIVTLNLKVIDVIASIEPPSMLGCSSSSITLSGYSSSFGPGYSYLWKTKDGKILSDPTLWEVMINKPGTYELIVSYKDGLITCSKSDMVTVTADTTKPKINAGPDGQLSCTDSLLTLKGSISSPMKYGVNWTTTNGSFGSKSDTISPVIKSPGMYIMHVTDSSNFCITLDTVIITVDASLPKSIINGTLVLNCKDSVSWLNGLQSDSGPDITFNWTTNGGSIISKTDSLVILINTPGQYSLQINNTKSGCKSISSITVTGDFATPGVNAGQTDTLSCSLTSLNLSGQSSIPDSISSYLWSSSDGKIVSGANTLTPLINKPGNYILKVINNKNGCSQLDTVQVVNDKNLPVSVAGNADTITCIKSSIILNGTGSSIGPDVSYQWTTSNGNITNPADQITTNCDKEGVYILTVVNKINGCSSIDSVTIIKNITPPIAKAGITDTLTCIKTDLNLNGTGSSTGVGYTYMWSTLNGNIVSGQNTLNPDVNTKGNYTLVVTNTKNGCTSSSKVNIKENIVPPDVTVVPTEILTCTNPVINLSATNNSVPGQYTYQWTTVNGVILSGQNTLTPSINKEGTYTLITTDKNNGCTDSDIVTVSSMGEIPQINAGIDTILNCSHPVISLGAKLVYTGGNIKISWTTLNGLIQSGVNTLTPQVNKPGLYTITVKDTLTGCTNFDQITVGIDTIKPQAILLIPEKLSCIKLSTILEANSNNPQWTYNWTTTNGNITGGNSSYSAQVDQAGLYTLVIHSLLNGCDRMLSTAVTEDKVKPSISAGPDKMLTCDLNNANLNGTVNFPVSNYAIQWLTGGIIIPGANNLTPNVNKEGSYVLIITDNNNGCISIDTVQVTQNSNIPTDFVAKITGPGCLKNGSAEVLQVQGGVGPYQYAINGGAFQSQSNFGTLSPGDYTITIKDQNGCKYDKIINIPEPQPITVVLPDLVTIEYGTAGQLTPIPSIPVDQIDKVNWNPINGLSCSDCLYPLALPDNLQIYHLTITDKFGCTASSKVKVLVIKDFKLYIPNVFSPDADGINDVWYPLGDPTKITNIKLLRIFDRWGELMYEATDFPINDPAYGWNGKSKGKYLNPAVFVYYLEAEFIDGSTQLYKGDITIFR